MVSPNKRLRSGTVTKQAKKIIAAVKGKKRKRKETEDYDQVEEDIQFLVSTKKPRLDIVDDEKVTMKEDKKPLKEIKNNTDENNANCDKCETVPSVKVSEDNREINRRSPNGFLLPDPLPRGEVLTDTIKQQWVLGKPIGVGGFGELYLASYQSKDGKTSPEKFVIKVNKKIFVVRILF